LAIEDFGLRILIPQSPIRNPQSAEFDLFHLFVQRAMLLKTELCD